MNEREFCYWLQGLFEVADPKSLTEAQTAMIRDHLKLVFTKVTPDVRPTQTTILPKHFEKFIGEFRPPGPIGPMTVTC